MRGASEVKIQTEGEDGVFRGLYCLDFISNDGEPRAAELVPQYSLAFEPVTARLGTADLRIEHLSWDDVLIYHDLPAPPSDAVAEWFERWFDPEDERHVDGAELGEIIHSLLVQPGCVSADLGTAPPQAFWEMLGLLESGGATNLRVSSSRAEAEQT